MTASIRKTNNTNLVEVGETVFSDLTCEKIVIKAISPRWTKETHGHEGLSHAYIYEENGQDFLIWPWEICRLDQFGNPIPWGPGLNEYGECENEL